MRRLMAKKVQNYEKATTFEESLELHEFKACLRRFGREVGHFVESELIEYAEYAEPFRGHYEHKPHTHRSL